MIATEVLQQLTGFILVAICWGSTNPLIKAGSAGLETVSRKYPDGGLKKWLAELKYLLTRWQYVLPLALNLSGSVVYYYTLGKSDMSLAVPITNSLTFVFSLLTGLCLGEELGGKGNVGNEQRSGRKGVSLIDGCVDCRYMDWDGSDSYGRDDLYQQSFMASSNRCLQMAFYHYGLSSSYCLINIDRSKQHLISWCPPFCLGILCTRQRLMFYVTGEAFLSTFSTYNARSERTAVASASSLGISASPAATHLQQQEKIHPSSVIKEQQNTERSLSLYPFVLMTAAVLTSLSYLYTLLLAPLILQATTEALANGTYPNSTDTNTTRPPPLPLLITCPALTPRPPPCSVLDLRADDIKVVIGVGDSVMAGFGAKGIQNGRFVSLHTLKEARGVSFALGGDHGRVTVPNLIHYYSHDLYGSSVGDQMFTLCFGDQFCPSGQYKPEIDVLNGAQSGARSTNLNHELDYLLSHLEDAYSNNKIQRTDWKLLTLFIGSNDICHACAVNSSLPEPYALNVQLALERIRLNIPQVLVQIIGMIRVDEIFTATQAHPEYCRPFARNDFVLSDHECGCAHSAANRTIMSQLMPQYNAALSRVASFYQDPMYSNDTFGVVFRALPVDINSFPIQAISNVDCFHPSALAHEWFAKQLWKLMHTPTNQSTPLLTFRTDAPIYCPTDADRLQLI